jgi:hypothetical protein
MIMEIAVTIRVSMITAKSPNSPENGFHDEENMSSDRDCSSNMLKEPSIRIPNNKKNKKITDTVTMSINRVPTIS